MGKVFARLIHKGVKRFNDIPQKWKTSTEKAFKELYGVTVQDWESWKYGNH